jgi:hypothetical protein
MVVEGVTTPRLRVAVMVVEGEIRARVPEMVGVGDSTARVGVAVDETTPREREIVAVLVAVGETKCD